ncbi:MAG: Unknown protein [uncultured Thiotrichaceae bacterium]|uniref:Tetratricopeptide repeat protein n=1 Tax=uncultured Thiotrichaceae bacterium TaxID=298394 RepID=A0A6S6SHA8_9GAMM|nr:MAG: Unknown protein [uncultured Thiotrichaceae bacterium]
MDIWGWVYDAVGEVREAGHEHLADAIFDLPSDVVNGRHEEIDLYIAELVAEAKSAGFTWIELYIRHWYMQSKVLHRGEPKEAIKEVVSLLEFAYTEENRDCPQSICVVQDMGSCYGQFDGPGYAEERIAVAGESLEKINVEWPCYKCISAEYAEALCDAQRYEECIRFLDKVDADFIESGRGKDTSNLLLTRTEVVIRQGDYVKARKMGEKLLSYAGGSNFALDTRAMQALIEAFDGQFTKASELLPEFDRIQRENSSLFLAWAETMYLIMKAVKEQQTDDNIQSLLEIAKIMQARGTYRQAFSVYGWLIELTALFSTELDSNELLAQMKTVKEKLNRDFGASDRMEVLEAMVAFQ